MINHLSETWRSTIAVLLLLAATWAVYSPGLSGPFVFDDSYYLLSNEGMRVKHVNADSILEAIYSSNTWFPRRGIARLSFATDYYLAGGYDSTRFKTTNLILHLFNGALIFALAYRLLRRRFAGVPMRMPLPASLDGPGDGSGSRFSALARLWPMMSWQWMAVIGTGLWLLHPIQLTSVLYATQRFTEMSALFVIAGLIVYVAGRELAERHLYKGLLVMLLGLGSGAVLGVLCKRNAALIVPFALCIELFFFQVAHLGADKRRMLNLFRWVVLVLPLVLGVLFIAYHWDWVHRTYTIRPFDLEERALTQARLLFFYLGLLALPHVGRLTLFHDDVVVSQSLLEPMTTLFAVIGLVVLAVLAAYSLRKRWLIGFVIAWYFVGHSMESTIIGLELVFEHRNYLPSAPICVGVAVVVVGLIGRIKAGVLYKMAPVVALLAVLALTTFVRSTVWESETSLIAFSAEQHPTSPRWAAQRAALARQKGERYEQLIERWQTASRLADEEVMPMLELYTLLAFLHYYADRELLPEEFPDSVASNGAGGEYLWPEKPPVIESIFSYAPGIHNAAGLKALMDALRLEVDHRLATAIVSPTTIAGLRKFADCYISDVNYCRFHSAAVRHWLELAIKSKRARKSELGHLYHALARYHAKHREFDVAMQIVDEMQRTSPERAILKLIEALIAMQGGMFEVAESALNEAQEMDGPLGPTGRRIEAVRRRLEQARAKAAQNLPAAGSSRAADSSTSSSLLLVQPN